MRDEDIVDDDTIDALNGRNISPRRGKRRSQQVRYKKMSGGRSRSSSKTHSKRRFTGTDFSEGGGLSVTSHSKRKETNGDIGTSSDSSISDDRRLAPNAFKWPHKNTTTAEYDSFEEDSDEKLEMQPVEESVQSRSVSSVNMDRKSGPKRKRSSFIQKGNPYQNMTKRQFRALQKAMKKAETESDFEVCFVVLLFCFCGGAMVSVT